MRPARGPSYHLRGPEPPLACLFGLPAGRRDATPRPASWPSTCQPPSLARPLWLRTSAALREAVCLSVPEWKHRLRALDLGRYRPDPVQHATDHRPHVPGGQRSALLCGVDPVRLIERRDPSHPFQQERRQRATRRLGHRREDLRGSHPRKASPMFGGASIWTTITCAFGSSPEPFARSPSGSPAAAAPTCRATRRWRRSR